MSEVGHSRHLKRLAATSAVTLNADIRLRCDICRNGPKPDSCTAAKNVVISGPPSHLAQLGNADRREFLRVGE